MATKLVNGVLTWVPDTDIGTTVGSTTELPNSSVISGAATGGLASNSLSGNPYFNQAYGYNIGQSNIPGAQYTPEVAKSPETLKEEGFGDKFSRWFTPQGDKGTSLGGNVMSAVGTGVGALTGLAGAYYTKKNYDLQKDNQKYLQAREAQSDARKSQFAANAGNSATY